MRLLATFLSFFYLSFLQAAETPNSFSASNASIVRAPVADLQAIWVKPCQPIEGISVGNVVGYDATSFLKLELTFATNPECSGIADIEVFTGHLYDVPVYTPGRINPLDLSFQIALIRLNNGQLVNDANANSLCGFNDWQLGVDKDVTGLTCGTGVAFPAVNTLLYQIFSVQGDSLLLGLQTLEEPGISPETRPTVLDPVAYLRQPVTLGSTLRKQMLGRN